LGGFFAYDEIPAAARSWRLGTLTEQGRRKLITATGNSSEVRIFDKAGNLKNTFQAYDNSVSGGMKISAADIDNDGSDEILVGNVSF
jgi:hypothetical protein